jgi:hypothetical protein
MVVGGRQDAMSIFCGLKGAYSPFGPALPAQHQSQLVVWNHSLCATNVCATNAVQLMLVQPRLTDECLDSEGRTESIPTGR